MDAKKKVVTEAEKKMKGIERRHCKRNHDKQHVIYTASGGISEQQKPLTKSQTNSEYHVDRKEKRQGN